LLVRKYFQAISLSLLSRWDTSILLFDWASQQTVNLNFEPILRYSQIMAHRRIQGRQAAETVASESTSSLPQQPTTTIALSTTFTPPASCTLNRLTIQPPPVYLIWANEPVPFANTTFSDCYPSEFLRSYTSVASGTLGSSVVPVMSPLVCPQNYCVEYVRDKYIACCPS
jgi:hypothetical protein